MKIQSSFSIRPQSPEVKAAEDDRRLREAAKMYESHFLQEMVKSMRKTVDRENGFLKPNFAEKIFTEQLDQKYVEEWANQGGVGLADLIYNQIRERYLATGNGGRTPPPKGAIPIGPDNGAHKPKSVDSIQMKTLPSTPEAKLHYRFEVPDASGAPMNALAPLDGEVREARVLGEGWNMVRLDHGQDLRSELTFPGHELNVRAGDVIETGRKLGVLDPGRPVLAWKLDWG